jgi:MFS family permease
VGDWATAAFGPFTLLMANGLLMAAGFLIAVFFPFLLPAAFGFLLIGLGDSIVVPMVYSLAARSTRMPAGYAIASVTMIGYGGFLLGPLLIGHTSEALNMQWAFGLVSLFSLCITVLAIKVKKEQAVLSSGEDERTAVDKTAPKP